MAQWHDKRYKNDMHYEGEMHGVKWDGLGRLEMPDGEWYEGQWKDGLRHGYGVYRYDDGAIYRGEWRGNKKTGIGVLIRGDGDVYEGTWKENNPHGPGLYIYKNGDVYVGDFWKGKPHGHGAYVARDGAHYAGFWEQGHRNGYGVGRLAEGHVFMGTWFNDQKLDGSLLRPTKPGKILEVSYRDGAMTVLGESRSDKSDANVLFPEEIFEDVGPICATQPAPELSDLYSVKGKDPRLDLLSSLCRHFPPPIEIVFADVPSGEALTDRSTPGAMSPQMSSPFLRSRKSIWDINAHSDTADTSRSGSPSRRQSVMSPANSRRPSSTNKTLEKAAQQLSGQLGNGIMMEAAIETKYALHTYELLVQQLRAQSERVNKLLDDASSLYVITSLSQKLTATASKSDLIQTTSGYLGQAVQRQYDAIVEMLKSLMGAAWACPDIELRELPNMDECAAPPTVSWALGMISSLKTAVEQHVAMQDSMPNIDELRAENARLAQRAQHLSKELELARTQHSISVAAAETADIHDKIPRVSGLETEARDLRDKLRDTQLQLVETQMTAESTVKTLNLTLQNQRETHSNEMTRMQKLLRDERQQSQVAEQTQRSQIMELTAELKRLRAQISQHDNQSSALAEELAMAQAAKTELQRANSQLSVEMGAWEQTLATLKQKYEAVRVREQQARQMVAREQQLRQDERDRLQAQLDQAADTYEADAQRAHRHLQIAQSQLQHQAKAMANINAHQEKVEALLSYQARLQSSSPVPAARYSSSSYEVAADDELPLSPPVPHLAPRSGPRSATTASAVGIEQMYALQDRGRQSSARPNSSHSQQGNSRDVLEAEVRQLQSALDAAEVKLDKAVRGAKHNQSFMSTQLDTLQRELEAVSSMP
eukprot:TRINITY_DN14500_c0_g1_i1.p1 TRINITY_DN14500_c0_g1~~TRINITY_DN14500_c0_g1_i1.p1  ORF type:complete len:926 (+),score=221.90 TRINITY_DN14500_c0_g1_i1:136-2778(+)